MLRGVNSLTMEEQNFMQQKVLQFLWKQWAKHNEASKKGKQKTTLTSQVAFGDRTKAIHADI